jgi:proline iminopeptidase
MRARYLFLGLCVVVVVLLWTACRAPRTPVQPAFNGARVQEGWIRGADGVRLFYRLVGSGTDTVVFVHGGPGTGMREGYDLERITAFGHALLMYDQRGAGMSELVSDTAHLGLPRHAADLDAVLAAFHVAHPRIIGLSWGAAIAAEWAALHADAASRIVFLSPISPTQGLLNARFAHVDSVNGRPNAGGLAGRLAEAAAAVPDSLVVPRCRAERAANYAYRGNGPHAVKSLADPCDYPIAVLRNRVLVRAAELQLLGSNYDLRPTLRRVQAPSLVIEGADTNVPLEATRAFAAALPHGRLTLVPAAGHQNWLDRPDLVFPMIDAFFRE